jgi:hypothetical protein
LRNTLSAIDYEKFKSLCDAAKKKYEQKMQEEEEVGEFPDEFQGKN